MVGQSKYGFSTGVVTVTQLDPDAYAPNDAELNVVKEAMERMIANRDPHLTFTVKGLRVEIESLSDLDELSIMKLAVKPLQANERIHP